MPILHDGNLFHASEETFAAKRYPQPGPACRTLVFVTRGGQKFTLHPGEVLIAEDNTGTGHRWNPVDDQPWRRGYVVLKPGAPDSFIPNDPAAAKECKASCSRRAKRLE